MRIFRFQVDYEDKDLGCLKEVGYTAASNYKEAVKNVVKVVSYGDDDTNITELKLYEIDSYESGVIFDSDLTAKGAYDCNE